MYRIGVLALLFVFFLAGSGYGQPAQPVSDQQTEAQPQAKVSIDFRDADIRDILKIIAGKAGLNLFVEKSVRGNVTIRAVEIPALDMIDYLVGANGFAWEMIGSTVFVADEKKLRKSTVRVSKTRQMECITAGDAAKVLSQTIKRDIKIATLDERNALILSGTESVLQEALDLCETLDRPTPRLFGWLTLTQGNQVVKSARFEAAIGCETVISEELAAIAPGTASGSEIPGTRYDFEYVPERVSESNGVVVGRLAGSVHSFTGKGAGIRTFRTPVRLSLGKKQQVVKFDDADGLTLELGVSLEPFTP
jgi:hypothetical protein